MAKKKVSKIKVKKKQWVKIQAPKIFGEKEIGESYLSAPEQAVNRVMEVTLRDLTGDVKDQNTNVKLRITEFKNNFLKTKLIGFNLATAFVKRLVRKSTSRIDDQFKLKTNKGEDITIKSLMITRNRVQASVRTELRKRFKAMLQEELEKTDFPVFVHKLVTRKLRLQFKKQLQKTYPLKEATVRVLKLNE